MKVLVYLEEEKLTPRGGPLGVGYYYYTEMKKRGDSSLDFLHIERPLEEVRNVEKKVFSYLPHFLQEIYRNIRDIKKIRNLLYGKPPKSKVDFSKYDIVHFHQTVYMYLERENLKDYKGIVVLSSHSPVPYGQEQCLDVPRIITWGVPHMKEKYEEVDKYAFERADYIIFPCPEAEEPYYNNWPYYKTFHEVKPNAFNYVLTGITPASPKRDRKGVLEELGIKADNFIISYVGRHNTVKGYDKLKIIGQSFLEEHQDSYVIVAGRETPFKRLDHLRWIEIGWTTDPHSYIAASDVFVLPNKETYFDIVMIEILSLGKIVVASRTGGNKYFERMGVKGVFLYNTVEEAVSLLSNIKKMTVDERKELGKENYNFYQQNLTVSAMYDNYLTVLKKIYSKTI